MIIGLISGAMGPFSNAPIDTIKTRKFELPLRPYAHELTMVCYPYRAAKVPGIPRADRAAAHSRDRQGHVEDGGRALVL